jgi:hypothetical protein
MRDYRRWLADRDDLLLDDSLLGGLLLDGLVFDDLLLGGVLLGGLLLGGLLLDGLLRWRRFRKVCGRRRWCWGAFRIGGLVRIDRWNFDRGRTTGATDGSARKLLRCLRT